MQRSDTHTISIDAPRGAVVDLPQAHVARRRAVVAGELQTVRTLCEGRPA